MPPFLYKQTVRPFLIRIFVAYITIYLGFAIGYGFFGPRAYNYKEYSFIKHTASIFFQPTSEIFSNGKRTYWYDWKTINKEDLKANSTLPLSVSSKKSQYQNNTQTISWQNTIASLFAVDEAAVIQPKKYVGKWSVIFCSNEICKESNLFSEGATKVLIDGDTQFFGRAEDGKYIEINILDIIKRWDRSNIELF